MRPEAARAGRASARGSGRTPTEPGPRPPQITTPMVALAWQILDARERTGNVDQRAAAVLAQTILKATGDLP